MRLMTMSNGRGSFRDEDYLSFGQIALTPTATEASGFILFRHTAGPRGLVLYNSLEINKTADTLES